MTDQDIARNMRAVAHAIAQQELEGLTVPAATTNDLRRVARGEISSAEAIRNVYARFGNVPVFQP
jgi:Antitoxin VbhA